MSSSNYENLLRMDREMRAKLGTHITCYYGKEAEAASAAQRLAEHQLGVSLMTCVQLNEAGEPNDLQYLATFCKNVYDAPLDQELQTPRPLTDQLYEIRETVTATGYPIEHRNHIIDIFTDLIRHARLDNCARNQLGITIEAIKTANQRTAAARVGSA